MNKYLFPFAALLIALFCGCNYTDYEGSGFDEIYLPRMSSFGFYQSDNSTLDKDYVVQLSSSVSEIKITLPALADKEALIARYTLVDGSDVLVKGVTQQNGVTPNDFSLPVDYFVTDGKTYARYSIIVSSRSAMEWSPLPTFDHRTVYTYAKVLCSPVNHLPYLVYKGRKNADGEDDYRAEVLRLDSLDATQWTSLGMTSGGVYSSYMDCGFAPSGNLYVAYANEDEKVHGTTVERLSTSLQWSTIGTNLEDAQATYLGMGVIDDNCLICGCTGNTTATYYRTNAVSIFDGSDWHVALGPCGSLTCYKTTLCAGAGVAYEMVMERNAPYPLYIYRYANGAWSQVADCPQEGTNAIYAGTFKMATDASGNLYTLTADDGSGTAAIRIRKYDVSTDRWSTVSGNPTPIAAKERHIISALAIAPNGTPFVAYYDAADSNLPKCIYLDPKSHQWSDPQVVNSVGCGSLGSMSFTFSASGIGYLSYLDANNVVRVCQYK